MKKWILKAIVQKVISFFPYKHRINYLFQKYVTKGVQLSKEYFEDRLLHFKYHSRFYEKYKGSLKGAHILELGTGWYPVIPIGFFLSGADMIYTVDISKLTSKDKILATLQKFIDLQQNGNLNTYCQPLPSRLTIIKELLHDQANLDFEQICQRLHLHYLIADARKLPLQNDQIDLITSNNTFEHIYPEVLKEILLDFKRVLKGDGLMSHFIDMSDHFAHLDSQITIYNFLQFSEKQWRFIDNSIQPQNRWRISHYRSLYESIAIPISEELNRPGDIEAVEQLSIADIFRTIPVEELAISHGYLVSALGEKS